MIGIVLWILFFMLLVVLHEFGHFLAAKKSGVKVKEFWIGIPPKICTFWKDKSGTEYTLNWIPLGGFVSLKWDDTEQTIESKDKDSFQKAKLWKKVIIILAGVAMNLLIAFVIFTGIFMAGRFLFSLRQFMVYIQRVIWHQVSRFWRRRDFYLVRLRMVL